MGSSQNIDQQLDGRLLALDAINKMIALREMRLAELTPRVPVGDLWNPENDSGLALIADELDVGEESPKYVLKDPTLAAYEIIRYGNLAWRHGQIYGLRNSELPIYRSVMAQVEKYVDSTRAFNALGKERWSKRVMEKISVNVDQPGEDPAEQSQWDAEHWDVSRRIVFADGMALDANTGEVRYLLMEDRATWCLTIPYQPATVLSDPAAQPMLEWLSHLFAEQPKGLEDERLVGLLLQLGRAMQPWLMGDPFQNMVLLVGDGHNGKGTWLRILEHLFGGYNQTSSLEDFDETKSRFGLETLTDALIISIPDSTGTALTGTARLKRITGDDKVVVERKGIRNVSMRLRGRIWISTPKLPHVSDYSPGWLRRLLPIIFDRTISDQEFSPEFESRLHKPPALMALVHLAIQAWQRYVTSGDITRKSNLQLGTYWIWHPSTLDALASYRAEVDPFFLWTSEDGFLIADEALSLGKSVFYDRYLDWCNANGVSKPLSRQRAGEVLARHHVQLRRSDNVRLYDGIGFRGAFR